MDKDLIKEKVRKLLSLMEKDSEFTFDVDTENKAVNIKITDQKDGALIGFRGKNLQALERIVSLMANKDLPHEEKFYISIDVNDYKINREKQLRASIKTIGEQVLQTGKPYELSAMSPRERRIVHDEINSMEGLKSESIGEDEQRRVVISVKGSEDTKEEVPEESVI